MSVRVQATFRPLRLSLSRREGVELKVVVGNPDDLVKMVTLKVQLPGQLSFDKSGYKTTAMERIEALNAKTEKVLYYVIFPKPNTQAGEHTLRVMVQEHGRNAIDIKDEQTKRYALTVSN